MAIEVATQEAKPKRSDYKKVPATERSCSRCSKSFPEVKFKTNSNVCNSCRGSADREKILASKDSIARVKKHREAYRSSAKGQKKHRELHIKRVYGLSSADYDKKYEAQKGCCSICHKPLSKYLGHTEHNVACVDHNHKTGKVRGLLCGSCNLVLGKIEGKESLLYRFVEYLEEHKEL